MASFVRRQEKCITKNFSDPNNCPGGNCTKVTCPQSFNKKTLNSNADVIQSLTATQRAVNAIKYGRGGRIVYGNKSIINNNPPFIGNIPPLRNKF